MQSKKTNRTKTMKSNYYLTAAMLFAGSLVSAQAGPKDEVANAIKELEGNYSWTLTMKRPERPDSAGGNNSNRWGSGTSEGKTADGIVYLKSTRGDRTMESLVKGDKAATKGDSGWTMVEERASTGGGDGAGADQRRGRGRGRSLQNYKSPATQAEELLGKISELKQDGDAYTGDLTEEAAKEMVSFGGGRTRGGGDAARADRPERPQPTGVKASAKFWIKDGVLSKYETSVDGKVKFNDQERDLARTTTVEFNDVGKTKIDVPDEVKTKLGSAGAKPAAAKPAEEK
jgi:hypothetical protein